MNDEAPMTNDEKMRNDMCESFVGCSARSYLPFNVLTIQRFNVAKP
jgi:hypothetical protein